MTSTDPSETLEGGFTDSSSRKPGEDHGGFTVCSSRAPVKIEEVVVAKSVASTLKRYIQLHNKHD